MNIRYVNKGHVFIFCVYLIGFSVGTISHTIDIGRSGFLGYTFAPMILNLFWTSLVVIDPLVIFCLFTSFRFAINLAIVVMALDIFINLAFGLFFHHKPVLFGLMTQIPFGIFVLVTSRLMVQKKTFREFLFSNQD